MIGQVQFKEIGRKIAGCLKDYEKDLNEAYLNTEDDKGLTISASIKISPDNGDYKTDISMSFVKEKVVIKSTFWSSNQLRLPLLEGEQGTDSDLRTKWHTLYMAYGLLERGFEGFLAVRMWLDDDLPEDAMRRMRAAKLGGVVDISIMETAAVDPPDKDQAESQGEEAAEGESCWRPDEPPETQEGGEARA